MLVTKIELFPFGNEKEKEELAEIKIINLGNNAKSPAYGNYKIVVKNGNMREWEGYIQDFPRALGSIELTYEALNLYRKRYK
jgi:hypothetical protein